MLDHPVTGTVYDSWTSLIDIENSSLRFNKSQASEKNTRTEYELRPKPWKKTSFFPPSPLFLDEKSISKNSKRKIFDFLNLNSVIHFWKISNEFKLKKFHVEPKLEFFWNKTYCSKKNHPFEVFQKW